jgi:hypothetical protein
VGEAFLLPKYVLRFWSQIIKFLLKLCFPSTFPCVKILVELYFPPI